MMKLFRKITAKIYIHLLSLYDRKTSQICTASVGDLCLMRTSVEHNQFLVASRYIDIAAYMEKGDESFFFQNSISYLKYGDKHRESDGNGSFSKLIESYKSDGYNEKSVITADKNLRLMDGTHRVASNLYFKTDIMKVRVVKRRTKLRKDLEEYYNSLLPTDIISDINATFNRLQSWLLESGNTFCCVVKDKNKECLRKIKHDLSLLCYPLRITGKSVCVGGVLL